MPAMLSAIHHASSPHAAPATMREAPNWAGLSEKSSPASRNFTRVRAADFSPCAGRK
jgi:hypothetical protein